MTRTVEWTEIAAPATDGAGVRIRRIAGMAERMDPFLLLDEIRTDVRSDVGGGFPEHPHRGFETLTWVREGGFEHRDHLGNRGQVGPGQAQWMRAGRGILHSEMPLEDASRFHGFQLWINLPGRDKGSAPDYREISPRPERRSEHAELTWIASAREPVGSLESMIRIAEVTFDRSSVVALPEIADAPRILAYVFDGAIEVGTSRIEAGTMVSLAGHGDPAIHGDAGTGLLLLAGAPIGEPVVQHGPFVMNHAAEIEQAIRDYRSGQLTAA